MVVHVVPFVIFYCMNVVVLDELALAFCILSLVHLTGLSILLVADDWCDALLAVGNCHFSFFCSLLVLHLHPPPRKK